MPLANAAVEITRPPAHIRHVAVCAFPFGTHAAPLLHLVSAAAATTTNSSTSTTPAVRFTFFNTDRSNSSLFKNNNDICIVPRSIPDGLPSSGTTTMGSPEQAIGMFMRAAPDNLRQAIAEAEAEPGVPPVVCVVSDAFMWFCRDIAAERKVPWVPLWTAGPASLAAHVCTDMLRAEFQDHKSSASRSDQTPLDNVIPGFTNVTLSDLPEMILVDQESPVSRVLHEMSRALPSAAAVPINSFYHLDTPILDFLNTKMLPNLVLNVGPFSLFPTNTSTSTNNNDDDEYGCLPWLDTHLLSRPSSVAYISFGTVTVPPPDEIAALASALESTGVPFLWSIPDRAKSHLPPGFAERLCGGGARQGKVVPWAPQRRVLAHPSVGAFVTHCGWNSITESLASGVPMVCRAFFGDQGLNCRFVESVWRVGVGVEGGRFTKSGVEKALRRVLLDEGEEARGMTARAREMRRLAEEAVKPDGEGSGGGGSSVRDMNKLAEIVLS